ncbi:MAG: cobyrinate a,c-diamide synthase, partial [Candidatus Omnitrophica bacterium]|nr:cobyrinate a,c-diamide synthase [Candidatus Omnitrophota bacterium]
PSALVLGKKAVIAVARDRSFHFYYQDNLDILEHFGAKLRYFSPLKSKSLPVGTSGIYIGGGFPEMFARELAANKTLRRDIKAGSRQDMPIYAECGGLMYLMRELRDADKKIFPMAGVFPGRIWMGNSLRMFGYYKVKAVKDNILSRKNAVTKGHVFHWSYVTGMPKQAPRAFRLERRGKVFYDGYMKNNTLAGYLHTHFGADISWAKGFVESCFDYKNKRGE